MTAAAGLPSPTVTVAGTSESGGDWTVSGVGGGIAALGLLLGWWAAMATGRMPRGLRDLVAWGIGYYAQANAYVLLLTPRLPELAAGPRGAAFRASTASRSARPERRAPAQPADRVLPALARIAAPRLALPVGGARLLDRADRVAAHARARPPPPPASSLLRGLGAVRRARQRVLPSRWRAVSRVRRRERQLPGRDRDRRPPNGSEGS